ncbi:helicase C-terminal domain-containing protein [Pokkaliibacter sp. CJK22405]|uniref:helicase C-terminal domain-containing protein n=1 Tax=Pokkaliibacter sp. CJK22405 TaxID=3384615 RepID=UPI0039851FE9
MTEMTSTQATDRLSVSVGNLCRFSARTGSIDMGYTPSPSAIEGMEGHLRLQRRRPESYEPEYALEAELFGIQLRGRADGIDPQAGLIEEIKTHRGQVERISPERTQLHWAQLKVYGALYCHLSGRANIQLRLTYFNLGNDQETQHEECFSAPELFTYVQSLIDQYRRWAEQEAAHRETRDHYLATLSFPFADFRHGQRPLAEAAYKSAMTGKHLLLQAPTGIGKTLGITFPVLKAMPAQQIDRLFFLTMRTTARQQGMESLTRLLPDQEAPDQENMAPLRILELSGKQQACLHPDKACTGLSCPLANDFYDRLANARAQAVTQGALSQAQLGEIAAQHQLCPYFFAQEMTYWADVIIADANHYFDQSALLFALRLEQQWKVSVVIDEAHNLIDRARGMYSTTLSEQSLRQTRRGAPASIKRGISSLLKHWPTHGPSDLQDLPLFSASGTRDTAAAFVSYLDTLPDALNGPIARLVSQITDYLTEHAAEENLQQLLFDLLAWQRLAERFGSHSVLEVDTRQQQTELSIRNIIPADFLVPRFAGCQHAILFSATLRPADYYQQLLGIENSLWLEVDSPFSRQQLEVRLVRHISTRYQDRAQSAGPIAQRIARQYQQQPGNYLVFTSSFAYLEKVAQALEQYTSQLPVMLQDRNMKDTQRAEFLQRFRNERGLVGLAVLGGAFAEGIDLPGESLIGVFIASLGLPPFDAFHELIRQRLEDRFAQGYGYTYLYPGLQKVVQAAGRVIRTPEDRGIVELIDPRYARPDTQELLPAWWHPTLITE